MAGTLTASVIKNDTTSPPTFQNSAGTEIGTLCRAWVNCNGSGGASIRAAYNVSSVTYISAGDYTVNFTNALPDANYCAVSMGSDATAAVVNVRTTSGYTTTSLRLWTGNPNHTTGDCLYINVAVFR